MIVPSSYSNKGVENDGSIKLLDQRGRK